MNLQCPNCQKLLTVQEHYAGQLMKCPLCKENFTVPALPGGTDPAPAFIVPPPTPAPPLPPAQEPYGLKMEPPATPAFHLPPADAPAFSTSAPEPAFSTAPAPASTPAWSAAASTPAPSIGPSQGPPVGYTRTAAVYFSDKVLQWVPPVAVLLIFILQFFTWVGVYPGGVSAVTQNAWQAAFGSYTQDVDLKDTYPILTEDDAKKKGEPSNAPSLDVLVLFYLLPFFLVTLVVTLAVAALPFVKAPLPPQAQQLLPWRWAIVAGLNAVLLLFLGMQLLLNFSLERTAKTWIDNRPDVKVEANSTKDTKRAEVRRGERLEWLQRTIWLRLVVLLHVLATLAAALVYWIEKRGPSHPLPKLELQW